jgi:hypothetical protein
MSGMTIRHGLPTALAAGAAAMLLAACGGGGSGNGDSSGKPDDRQALAFARCLREAGIDAPDPKISGGRMDQRIGIPKGISARRMQQIQTDCAKKTGGGPRPMSKADEAKFRDAALKFAQCMRAHGVDVPDPQVADGGAIMMKKQGSTSTIDPKSPAFQNAQKACQKLMPGGGKKGGGPMVGTSGPSK